MSQLDELIPAEIKDDDFHRVLGLLARQARIDTVLEIGSSSGEGSTEALVGGIEANPRRPVLYCMEVSRVRFDALARRYAASPQVRPRHASSVELSEFAEPAAVEEFLRTRRSALDRCRPGEVLGWLRQDREYITAHGVPTGGIAAIKRDNAIASFGLVLIDGSEFTGEAELNHVHGAGVIALDDINAFKNMANHERLMADPAYELCVLNKWLRNGYSIFVRREWRP